MKKPAGTQRKTSSGKKASPNNKKKTAKTGKISKNNKKTNSDAMRTFLLIAVLVVLTLAISLVIIKLYTPGEVSPPVITEPEIITPPVSVPEIPPQQPSGQITPGSTDTVSAAPRPPAGGAAVSRPAENLGSLVFVIDDAGNNLRELEPFLRISGPLTIAVLPGLPNSAEAARRIRAAGKEVILHQPMEAIGGQYPGPGAIYSGMSADEIRTILRQNIAEVGPVAGINNHQGSRITMDMAAMEVILSFCAENGLYFMDSRTTAETAAPAAANLLGLRIAQRDIFIDNEQDRSSMLNFITSGLTRAQRSGSAVMIGHTWSPELAPLLEEQFPLLVNLGYTLTTASDIINAR